MFRGGQGEAEPPGVVTDDLKETRPEQVTTPRGERGGANTPAATQTLITFYLLTTDGPALTCLSSSRSAYLMLGSSKVMAGLLLEKKSLKIRLMMLSKPPRISWERKAPVGGVQTEPPVSISRSGPRCQRGGVPL